MPEFRFRRKKNQRRTTLHDSEETAKQVQAAKDMVVKKPVKPILELPPPNEGEEPAADKVTEREVSDPEGLKPTTGVEKRNSFIQERERFFELLKMKYPEQANSLQVGGLVGQSEEVGVAREEEVSVVVEDVDSPVEKSTANGHTAAGVSASELDDQSVGIPEGMASDEVEGISPTKLDNTPEESPATSSSRYGECLYLRHGKSLRHCPMPSPVTLSTIKNLYINMFELSPTLLTSPSLQIYVQDKKTMLWHKLDDISMITDHCTLLLADSALSHTSSGVMNSSQADSDINMPLSSQPSQSDSVQDNDATPTSASLPKKNGLWRSGHTHLVQDLSSLPDNLPLQKNPPSLLPHTYPSLSTLSPSPLSSPPPCSNVIPTKVKTKARELSTSVKSLKSELSSLRQTHSVNMADLSASLNHTSKRIASAVAAFVVSTRLFQGGKTEKVEVFRRERLKLYGMKEGYEKCLQSTLDELQYLEQAVEEMRVDVVERRAKVKEEEVNTLTTVLTTITQSLNNVKAQYRPLETKMKGVMEEELKVIVQEEKFLEEEWPKLEEASERCNGLTKALLTMLQFAAVQSHRTPVVPHYNSVQEPDRDALMQNIAAIIPNHSLRMESLSMAEKLREKRKEIHSDSKHKVREFENLLKAQKQQLRKCVSSRDVENRREMKMKALYMEDRYNNSRRIAGGGGSEKPLPGSGQIKREKSVEGRQRHARNLASIEQNNSSIVAARENDRVLLDDKRTSQHRPYREWGQVFRARSEERYDSEWDRKQEGRSRWGQERGGGGGGNSGGWGHRHSQELTSAPTFDKSERRLQVLNSLVPAHGMSASTYAVHSQDSQHTVMPAPAHRGIANMRGVEQVYSSHSQPESFPSSKLHHHSSHHHHSSFLSPPVRRAAGNYNSRRMNSDLQEYKRKSFGCTGEELEEVAIYYDTLERKKMAARRREQEEAGGLSLLSAGNLVSQQSEEEQRGVAGSQRGVALPQRGMAGPQRGVFNPRHGPAYPGGGGGGLSNSSVSDFSSVVTMSTSGSEMLRQQQHHHGLHQHATSSLVTSTSSATTEHSVGSTASSANTASTSTTKRSFSQRPNAPQLETSNRTFLPQAAAHHKDKEDQGQSPLSPSGKKDNRATALPVTTRRLKKPQITGFPSRYTTGGDYQRSSKHVRTSDSTSPPSKEESGAESRDNVASPGAVETGGKSSLQGSKDGRKLKKRVMQKQNSGDVTSDSSTTPIQYSPRHQAGLEKEANLTEIFDSDTLPAGKKHRKGRTVTIDTTQQEQAGEPSHEPAGKPATTTATATTVRPRNDQKNSPRHRTSKAYELRNVKGIQQEEVEPRGKPQHHQHQHHRHHEEEQKEPCTLNTYTQHNIPSALKKPRENYEHTGQHFKMTAATSGHRHSQQHHTTSQQRTPANHNPGTKNLKVQFQNQDPGAKIPKVQFQQVPAEDVRHAHQASTSRSSGIPMRATKSAQMPSSSTDPCTLTSYPRSYTTAIQMRSASNGRVPNGRVHPHHLAQLQQVQSGGLHYGNKSQHHALRGYRKEVMEQPQQQNKGIMIGSLV